jgi:hypothetical protein
MAAATFVPLLGMPLLARFHPSAESVVWITGVLNFFGGPGHVAMTGWFYSDPETKAYFRARSARYRTVPLLLILGSTLTHAFWPSGGFQRHLTLVFWVWQIHHFQRQNWGLLVLTTRAAGGGHPSQLEDVVLRLAVVAGIGASIGTLGFGAGTVVERLPLLLFQAGLGLYAVVALLVVVALVREPGLRRSGTRLVGFLTATLFFVPAFVFADRPSAFLSYALAHGFQYVVAMGYVATKPRAPTLGSPILRLGLCSVVLGVVLALGGDVGLTQNVRPFFGFTLGVTMAHFVIDAGIWRFSDPFPRAYLSPAFDFGPASYTGRR